MRLVYGVHGYGRGHATRALAVLPELTARHDVAVFAGGDAYSALWPECAGGNGRIRARLHRIPTLGYFYGSRRTRSNLRTFRGNLPCALDLLLRGPAYAMIAEAVRDFRPDVVVSDAEAWTGRIANDIGVPLVSFDHFGVMVYCRPPIAWYERAERRFDALVYQSLMGRPQHVIVSSFYDAPPRRRDVTIVGPLLRTEVQRVTPRRGQHLLVYLNKGRHQFTSRIEAALRSAGLPVHVYGTERRDTDGPLSFRPMSNLPFVEDLASCRAVISTAGNQLVGEAVHFRKPILVMPEDCVEQRLNAAAVARLGIGMRTGHRTLSAEIIRQFLANETSYLARIESAQRDGRREAIEALTQAMERLCPTAPSAAPPIEAPRAR